MASALVQLHGFAGYATINGVLHLYVDPAELQAVIRSRNFGASGWLRGVELHARNDDAERTGDTTEARS